MKNFLTFKRMLAPLLIQILFWLTVIICVVSGVVDLFKGMFLLSAQLIILAPIVARIAAEFCVLFFRINETLTDIQQQLRAR